MIQAPGVRSPRHGPARWVWASGDPRPYHQYVLARRTFDTEGSVRAARLAITASDRYVVWINGDRIGRGPARSDPRRKRYDTYEIEAARLTSGTNVIAVRAYCYGSESAPSYRPPYRGNGYTMGERAGLWAELTVATEAGTTVIGTDETWRLRRAQAWDRSAGLINGWVGSNEVFDARLDDDGWLAADHADDDWEPAWQVPNRQHPWAVLVPRETAHPVERHISPVALVGVSEVTDIGHMADQSPPVLELPELLRQQVHVPLVHAKASGVSGLVGGTGDARLQAVVADDLGIRCPVVVLDFGRQVFGFPRVELTAESGAVIDMWYGQQLIDGRIGPGVRYGDRYTARDGRQTWQVGDYRQFRYLELAVRDAYAPTTIHAVGTAAYGYPVERSGSFESSDPLLTRLWDAAIATTELHLEDTIICDAQRERVAWSTGDGSHAVHGVYAAFGADPIVERWISDWPLTDRGDGMLKVSYPPEEIDEYNVPIFMMQWPTRVKESWLASGRRATLEALYPSVRRQVDWYEPHLDESGLIRELPYGNWLDWTPVDLRGANLGTNAIYVLALEDAATLADTLGEDADALRWRELAARVRGTAREAFWSVDRARFLDSHTHHATGTSSELGNALALAAGFADDERRAGVLRMFVERPPDVVAVSPLYVGYVMDALLASGADPDAWHAIVARFEPMLAGDNPTLWEGWSPYTGALPIVDEAGAIAGIRVRPVAYRSLCHSGGVLAGYVLSTRVLGVLPTAGGVAACVIRPHPVGTGWARGAYPTPRGTIDVAWASGPVSFELRVTCPPGTAADAILDRALGGRAGTLRIDEAAAIDHDPAGALRLHEGENVLRWAARVSPTGALRGG